MSAVLVALTLVFGVGLSRPVDAAEKGLVTDLTWGTSAGEQDRTASAIQDVRSPWVRLNANWADAEPSPGVYSASWFDHYDRAVELAHNAGARIVMLSYQSPPWASGSSNPETPPKDPGGFAHFMGYLAARYVGKVEAYEVWNEPNWLRFWSTGPDAAAYTRLLKSAYVAIKQADPSAKVLFGGLSQNDYKFVEEAYAAGAKGYFDAISVHPYNCSNAPETIVKDSDGRITRDSFPGYREVRSSMLARGDDKPIWLTEFGWSTTTQSCGVSDSKQADYLTRAYRYIERDPYVQVALWYELRNNFWMGDANTWEDQLGLLRTDFSPKAGYGAFKSYVPLTTQTLSATADAYVDQSAAGTNYGGATTVKVDNDPHRYGYLRFDVPALGTSSKATLQLYATTSSSAGYSVRAVSDNSWGEKTVSYSNAPPIAATVTSSSGSFSSGKWISTDVTPLVSSAKPVSFGLTTTSSSSLSLASREYGSSYAPRLVITASAVSPSNVAPPTTSGRAEAGQSLTANVGTWAGTQPFWYGYQWRRCDRTGLNCSDILGASNRTYALSSADVGSTLRVAVTVSNQAGWRAFPSEPTQVIAASGTPLPDTTPPDTRIDSGPSGDVGSTSAAFAFSATEAGSTFACKLDTGVFNACTSPQSYSGLSQGPHTFQVRATDPFQNTDQSPAGRTWTVDTLAPTVTSLAPAEGATGVALDANIAASFSEAIDQAMISTSTFTLVSATDGSTVAATVRYDAAAKTAVLDPSTGLLPNAPYTATVTRGVKDQAGNAIVADRAWSFTTSATSPSGAIKRQSTTTVVNSTAAGAVTIAKPFGTMAGEVLVSCLALNGGNITGAPAGWSPIASLTSNSNPHIFGYHRVTGSFEPASYTWALDSSISSGAGIARYSGVNNSTSLDTGARIAAGSSSATGSVPGLTTATGNAMLVGCMAINSSNASVTIASPSGMGEAWDLGGKRHELADGLQASPGASGNKTWTFSSGREWAGWLTALRPQ